MDSDEDEEFSVEEDLTVQHLRPHRYGVRLDEILSEVETKIPSLEFDDEDNEDDVYVWTPDNVPMFYKQFTSSEEAASVEKQNTETLTAIASSSSSVSCQTYHDMLVSQHDIPSSIALEDKTAKVINELDKKPITTRQPSSSMYLSYQGRSGSLIFEDDLSASDKTTNSSDVPHFSISPLQVDSNSQIYEDDILITCPASDTNTVIIPDRKTIIADLSSPPTDSDSLVDEQKFPTKACQKVAGLEVSVSSVSTLSLTWQTDNYPSVCEQHLSTTLNGEISASTSHLLPSKMCYTESNSTFHQHYPPTTTSRKTIFNTGVPNSEYSLVSLPSSVSFQTENTYSRNEKTDEAMQIIDTMERNVETTEPVKILDATGKIDKESHRRNDTKYGGQLDFNILSKINFNELRSVLGTNSKCALSDLLSSGSQQGEQSMHNSDNELMAKLSDLSKDQLSACCSVRDTKDSKDITSQSMYQKQRKVKGNRGSTKAIHSWSQLSSDDTSAQEPQTIYLDLRPTTTLEKEKEGKEHSESIQRILGLDSRESFSDSGSEDELAEWREMRTKFKERAKQVPENLKKSPNAYASRLTRESIRRAEIKAPLCRRIEKPTKEKLDDEELTGGLPFQLDCSTESTHSVKENSAKVQCILEKSTCLESNGDVLFTRNMQATTSKVDTIASFVSEVDEPLKKDRCIDEKYKETTQAKTTKKSFIDMDVNNDEIKAQNCDDTPVKITLKDNTCSNAPTGPKAINAYDLTTERNKVIPKENGKCSSSTDDFKYENDDKENTVVSNVRCRDEELGNTSYSTFHSRDKVQSVDKMAPCNMESEERQVTLEETDALNVGDMTTSIPDTVKSDIEEEENPISSTNGRISLYLNGTDEKNDTFKGVTRNFPVRAKSRDCMNSREHKHEFPFKSNMKPSIALTSNSKPEEEKIITLNAREDISREGELSVSNDVLGRDMHDVHRIMEHLKEEKTKQSLNMKSKTLTPNSGEEIKQDILLSSSLETPKAKHRNKKEMKKLKEKLRVNIESMRPAVTSSGKFPAAYNTPIIYDQEASFEHDQQGLLSIREDNLTLLLVVALSGCGEVNHQYSKGKNLGSGSEVNLYFALLSLLLRHCDPCNNSIAPFTVVGMQQAHQNGLLKLFVGVQPNEKVFDPNFTTRKGSKTNKNHAFHKAVSKYLSTHSLDVYLKIDEIPHISKMLSSCIAVGQDSNAVRRVFNGKRGFYWETIEMDGSSDVFQSSCCEINLENTVVFVRAPLYYHDSSLVLDLLTYIENEGCDVAGLRLINENNTSGSACCSGEHEILQSSNYNNEPRHTLALAVRGPFAISKMKKIIGSKISALDNPRGVPSHRSLYCPSYSNQAVSQLARMFGGRLTEDDIAAVAESSAKLKPCSPNNFPAQKPPALLVCSTRVAFYLIISPFVPSSFLGEILHICFLRGFVLHDIRRVQLSKRQGSNLGLSQLQFSVFCPLSGNTPFQSPGESPPGSPARSNKNFSWEATLALTKTNKSYPSTILVLQKENGLYHAASLVKRLFESLKEWMTSNSVSFPLIEENTPRMYFVIAQFNEASSKSLWGDVRYQPDTSLLKRARTNRFSMNCEKEQVCVLSSLNKEAIQKAGILLKKLYSDSNAFAGNWELLGIKSFPSLSLIQAKELTPYEIGDRCWQSSLKQLMSAAVFVFVLRGINIIQRLRDFLTSFIKMSSNECGIRDCLQEDWWISQTTEVAYRQLTVLFEEQELFSDETNRTNAKFVPPLRERWLQSSTQTESNVALQKTHRKRSRIDHKTCLTDDSSTSVETTEFREVPIIQSLLVGPRPLPTIALIKPRVVSTKKMDKIFKSVLQENFDIVALSMRVLTQSEAHVLVHDNAADYNDHMQYLTSGPSLLICLHRENGVKKLLDLLGPGDPITARSLDPFLLRGCYGMDSIHNAIHGSESYSSAICELKMLFPCGVCCEQTVDLEAEGIPCRVIDSTIGSKSERKLTKHLTQMSGIANNLISSLVQVNCLILTHRIVYGRSERKRIALVEVLDCLFSMNFAPVGMKMAMLSRQQVDEFLMLIGLEEKTKHCLEYELTEGPCIILALQRDNAITCFDSIIESIEGKRRSFIKHRKHIIQPQTEEESRNLLLYFFDGLASNSVQQICPV